MEHQVSNQPTEALAEDWRETIQGAIDELPYQHHLIPRLAQLLAAVAGQQAKATPLSDEELRKRWRAAGGNFYGPNIETGSMPESQLLPFLRALAKATKEQS